MRTVTVATAEGKFKQTVSVGGHAFSADEGVELGGGDAGPAPHELILAGLGACTSMTLGMYAARKGWPLRAVRVSLSGEHDSDGFVISRSIVVDGDLTDEQRQRLLEIAEKCPVHKTLTGTIAVRSKLTTGA